MKLRLMVAVLREKRKNANKTYIHATGITKFKKYTGYKRLAERKSGTDGVNVCLYEGRGRTKFKTIRTSSDIFSASKSGNSGREGSGSV